MLLRLLLLMWLLPGLAAAAPLRLEVQPVALCRTGAGCADPALDPAFLDRIWRQAGVTMSLRPVVRSDPLTIPGVGGAVTPLSSLSAFAMWQFEQGLAPRTAYLGLSGPLDGEVAALAFTTPTGSVPDLPFAVVEAGLPVRLQTGLAAQQLGHLMGAPAGATPGTVMYPVHRPESYAEAAFLPGITTESAAAARQSPLLTPAPVPVPGGIGLILSALATLGLALSRRRRSRFGPHQGLCARASRRGELTGEWSQGRHSVSAGTPSAQGAAPGGSGA